MSKIDTEYIVVSDVNNKVLLSTLLYAEARALAQKIRAAGGSVTIFKSTQA